MWNPPGGDNIAVGADFSVSAEPGDPAPDNEGQCDCDSNHQPVNWAATGMFSAPLSGDVDGEGKLDTSTPGPKTVTANISYEYKCSASGDTKWVDDAGNPWQTTYTVSEYYIEGPHEAGQNETVTFEAKASGGAPPPNVTGWDTSGGTQTGSGSSIQVSWSQFGTKTVTASIENYGDVTLNVEVMGTLDVSIASPDDPAIVAVDEPVTFTANEPTNGSGNYTYEWDFGSGTAPAGAKFKKVADGVRFGFSAAGRETTVTLTVRDGSNSGKATMKVIIPVVSVWSALADEEPPLWFFGTDCDPADLRKSRIYRVNVTPANAVSSEWDWSVSNPSKITLTPGVNQDPNSCLGTAIAVSDQAGDCEITVTHKNYAHLSAKTSPITIDTISYGERWTANTYNVTGQNFLQAYRTEVTILFHALFGHSLYGAGIEVNEQWLTGATNATGCNWPQPAEGCNTEPLPFSTDNITGAGGLAYQPQAHPKADDEPLSQNWLQYYSGQWNLGSSSLNPHKGRPAYWATWARYIDHGDHWPP